MHKSVEMELAGLAERAQAAQTRADWIRRILAELPGDVACPTISNEGERAHDGRPGAWLSFSRSYGETWTGAEVLAKLEVAGFATLPATLAKYGEYRRSPHVGLQTEIPEESSRAKLADCEPIAPVWIVPEQHTGGRACAFYRSPTGLTLRVNLPIPAGCYITAEREEFKGGWHYKRGSARLRYPGAWESVAPEDDGTPATQVCAHSRAYVDIEQGISGVIYFTPLVDHADFPMTAAQFLGRLEVLAQAKSAPAGS